MPKRSRPGSWIILSNFVRVLTLPILTAGVWAYIFEQTKGQPRQYELQWDAEEYAVGEYVAHLIEAVEAKTQHKYTMLRVRNKSIRGRH